MGFEVKPVQTYQGARYPSSESRRWAVLLRAFALTLVFGMVFAVLYVFGQPEYLRRAATVLGSKLRQSPPDYGVLDGDVAEVEPAQIVPPSAPLGGYNVVLGLPAVSAPPAHLIPPKKKKKNRKERRGRR